MITSFSLTVITVDKCQCICTRYKQRITDRMPVKLMIKLLWSIVLIALIPIALDHNCSRLQEPALKHRAPCYWFMSYSSLSVTLPVIYLLVSFLVPLSICLVCYIKIIGALSKYGGSFDFQHRIRTKDRQTVKTIAVLLILMPLFNGPWHVIHFVPIQNIRNVVLSLALFHLPILFKMITPILFVLGTKFLRQHFTVANGSSGSSTGKHHRLLSMRSLSLPGSHNHHCKPPSPTSEDGEFNPFRWLDQALAESKQKHHHHQERARKTSNTDEDDDNSPNATITTEVDFADAATNRESRPSIDSGSAHKLLREKRQQV